MAPALNHHFRNFTDENIVFDDQYHSHQKSFGRDNQHRGEQHSSCWYRRNQSPFDRYQGVGILSPELKVPQSFKFFFHRYTSRKLSRWINDLSGRQKSL